QEIAGIGGDRLALSTVSGTGTAAPPDPQQQPFWLMRASGPGQQQISFNFKSDDYRFVLMPADGTSPVRMVARFGVQLPWVLPTSLMLLLLGPIVAIAGIVVLTKTSPPPKVVAPPIPARIPYASPATPYNPMVGAPSDRAAAADARTGVDSLTR